MFIGSPAWIGMLVLGTLSLALAETPGDFIRPDAGMALFVLVLVMWFSPKIASVIDLLLRPEARRAFGGTARFLGKLRHRNGLLYSAVSDHVVWPHDIPGRPAVRPRDRLDRADPRRSCGSARRWRCTICGRTHCSAAARSACSQ